MFKHNVNTNNQPDTDDEESHHAQCRFGGKNVKLKKSQGNSNLG